MEATFHIGIVGLGSKGLFGFERLLANLKSIKFASIEIHLFNATNLFATGWIYDPKQPDYLKMNYPNIYISLEPPKEPPALIKILSFSQWQANKYKTSAEEVDYAIASRKEVGAYFHHYFTKLCASSPKNIKIHKHLAKVLSIQNIDEKYSVQTDRKNWKSPCFSSLLITTGHSPSISSKLQKPYPKQDNIPFIYPVNEKLNFILPNASIACKGMGLTAIDAILALTEGRGGEFDSKNKQEWKYEKSGKEPLKIYPFSISGIPIVPRNPHPSGPQKSYLFKRYINSFDSQLKVFDFEKELLPVIKQDMVGEYYFQVFKNYGKNLYLDQPFEEVKEEIHEFHNLYPLEKEFKATDLLYPKFNPKKLNSELLEYWKMWLEELERKDSPLVAAAGTWKNLSGDFNTLYSNNRLTANSKAKFTKTYFSLFNRVSYGPPIQNIKKMLALADRDILEFTLAKNPNVEEVNGKNYLTLNHNRVSFDVLLDARIPRGYDKNSEVLFTEKKSETIFRFHTSMLNFNFADTLMIDKNGNPLDEKGIPNLNICLYGTPTEGVLFDNDTLSRKRNDTASLWAQKVSELIKK
ncbi:FAD/NAD(P)-binding protein [Mesonia ostreae]|uniref:FAD/NAD(P)-binding protein n=1 Tax=Mesonia ostreae TaxID=861110 RepID=A0ABU2KK14_9FLAO|nr:FAD/NAD(P)-binding protein [Mesonia ostreae]MDT0295048.1 FAD/NAD(P)-binding protein [Mesonia ostreae]